MSHLPFGRSQTVVALLLASLYGCGGGGSSSAAPPGPGGFPPPLPTTSPTPPPVEEVLFVRDNAPAGGDGSLAAPFISLDQAFAVANAGETVFVFRGSGAALTGSLTIPAQVRLIGEGSGLVTQQDSIPAGGFPRIEGPLQLGGGNLIRGFQCESSGGSAVTGQSIVGATLEQNRFTNIALDAIQLNAVTGNVVIQDNEFLDDGSQDPREGVRVENFQSQSLSLTFRSNTFSTPDRNMAFDNGLRWLARDSANLTLVAEDNVVAVQGGGLALQLTDSAQVLAGVRRNRLEDCQLEGVSILAGTDDSHRVVSAVAVVDNVFNDNLGSGILLLGQGTDQSLHTWSITGNQIATLGNLGMTLVRRGASSVDATLGNNQVQGASQVGIQVTSGSASGGFGVPLAGSLRLVFDSNQVTTTGGSAFALSLVSNTQRLLFSGNSANAPITVLSRSQSSCLAAQDNQVGGAFGVTVENGFSLTYDNRGQTTPAVTFGGGGTVTLGPCDI